MNFLRRPALFLSLVFVFLWSPFAAFGQGLAKRNLVQAELLAETKAVAPGGKFTVAVRLKMEPGWHVYWENPGDSGAPPTIEWVLPPGFVAGPIQWPRPQAHLDAGDLLTYVYEDEVLLLVEMTAPATLPEGDLNFQANLRWLVCEKICVPGRGSANLTLARGEPTAANVELFAQWRAQIPKSAGAPFSVTWDRSKADSARLQITGLPKDFTAEFFPLPPSGVKVNHPELSPVAENGNREFTLPVSVGGAPDLPWRGVLVTTRGSAPAEAWALAAVDDKKTPVAVNPNSANGGVNSSSTNSSGANSSPTTFSSVGSTPFWFRLWGAFLGGLILNLMPCVLPVIALKIFGFVQQSREEPARVFRLGLAYVSGVFAFFLSLAALVVALHAQGISFSWGAQFQNPTLFTGLISLVFLFALNMLGVFEIVLGSKTSSALSSLSSREGYSGAFLHGVFTTLLGTSCTAPYLGTALGFAFGANASALHIFLIFASIAAGMSLPYFLLTANPRWMRFLPKPGTWMERLKELVGFVLLGVVVWLLQVLGHGRGLDLLVGTMAFLLALGLAAWIYGKSPPSIWRWSAILVIVGLAYFFALRPSLHAPGQKFAGNKTPAAGGIQWEDYSGGKLSAAMKAGQPVLIDFTADWCANCKYNERFILETDSVRAALKAKNILPLRADWTIGDEEITVALKKLGRAGVPVYVIYPGGETPPILLPEILTQELLLQEINKLKG